MGGTATSMFALPLAAFIGAIALIAGVLFSRGMLDMPRHAPRLDPVLQLLGEKASVAAVSAAAAASLIQL